MFKQKKILIGLIFDCSFYFVCVILCKEDLAVFVILGFKIKCKTN